MDIAKKSVEIQKSDISQELEDLYSDMYTSIVKVGMKWLTVSPARDDRQPSVLLDEWLEEFERFRKFANQLIIIVEFAHMRMHFHIVYSVTDRIKEYRTVNRWSKMSQTRIYKGEPRGGIEYLFKDIEESKCILPEHDVVYTIDDFNDRVDTRKAVRVAKRSKKIDTTTDKDIPAWMLCE